MILKIKNMLLSLSLLMVLSGEINGFFSKAEAKDIIALTLTNNSASNQSISLFSVSNNFAPYSTTPNTATDTVTTGSTPFYLAFNESAGTMYVTNQGGNTVSVIDCSTNTVIATVTGVGNAPAGIAYDPVNNRMYVACYNSNTVKVINCATNTVTNTISVGGTNPLGIAYNSANQTMYVTNDSSGNIKVISTATNTVTATITTGNNPEGLAYDPINNRMYVAVYNTSAVSVINCATNAVLTTVSVSADPQEVAYDSLHERMYVTSLNTNTVDIINCTTNTNIGTITGLVRAAGIAYDPVNNNMYVGLWSGNAIAVISTVSNTVTQTISAGGSLAYGVAYDSTNYQMFVAYFGSDFAKVIFLGTAVTASTNNSIPYNQLLNEITGTPIALEGLSLYSYSGNNDQVSQTITLNAVTINGDTDTEVIIPAINPDQTQSSIENLDTKGFVANGLNYIGMTLLAGQSMSLLIPYQELTPEEIKNNKVEEKSPDYQAEGSEYIYDGIEEEEVKTPFFLTIEEIINGKC